MIRQPVSSMVSKIPSTGAPFEWIETVSPSPAARSSGTRRLYGTAARTSRALASLSRRAALSKSLPSSSRVFPKFTSKPVKDEFPLREGGRELDGLRHQHPSSNRGRIDGTKSFIHGVRKAVPCPHSCQRESEAEPYKTP